MGTTWARTGHRAQSRQGNKKAKHREVLGFIVSFLVAGARFGRWLTVVRVPLPLNPRSGVEAGGKFAKDSL